MTDKKTLWSDAGRAGLVLGCISAAYYVASWGLGKLPDSVTAVLLSKIAHFLLWTIKFVGCILLLKLYMKKFAATDPECTNSDTFAFGTATAFLSAILYAAVTLAFVSFVEPDTFEKSLDLLRGNSMFNDAALEMMESMAPQFPTITFFSNLIYCWIFGTILSAILSRNIPSRNPFENK